MYAGKTTRLLEFVERANNNDQRVILFKPQLDNRYCVDSVVTHTGESMKAKVVSAPAEITEKSENYQLIAIDEVTLFGIEIVEVIRRLIRKGKAVICTGLNLDFRARPFEVSEQLAKLATKLIELDASCSQCQKSARFTYRKDKSIDSKIVVGGPEMYEARCKECFNEQ